MYVYMLWAGWQNIKFFFQFNSNLYFPYRLLLTPYSSSNSDLSPPCFNPLSSCSCTLSVSWLSIVYLYGYNVMPVIACVSCWPSCCLFPLVLYLVYTPPPCRSFFALQPVTVLFINLRWCTETLETGGFSRKPKEWPKIVCRIVCYHGLVKVSKTLVVDKTWSLYWAMYSMTSDEQWTFLLILYICRELSVLLST